MTTPYRKSGRAREYREFIVKTHHVWIVAIVLLALCFSFFWLGRWYESNVKKYYPAAQIDQRGESSRVASASIMNSEDMEQMITFFDRLKSENSSDIPLTNQNKVNQKKEREEPPQTKQNTMAFSKTDPKQSFYAIQVLAGSRKATALRDSEKLLKMGFPSYVEEEPGSSGTLYKVRVGKFSSREETSEVESRLKKQGYTTWVLAVD